MILLMCIIIISNNIINVCVCSNDINDNVYINDIINIISNIIININEIIM